MNRNSIIATILLAAIVPCSMTSCYYYRIPTYTAPYNQAGTVAASEQAAVSAAPQAVGYAPAAYGTVEPYWPFWINLFSWAAFWTWWGTGPHHHHGGGYHHGGGHHHGGHR